MTRGGQKKRQNDESIFAMGPGPPPPWIGPGPPPPGGWGYEGPPPPGGWGPGGPPPPGGWGPGLPPPGGWGPGGPPLGGWGPDGPPPGGWGLPGPPPGGWGPDGPPPGGWGPGGPPPGGWGPGGRPPGSWEPGGPPPPDGWGPGGPPPGCWGPGGPPPPEGWGPRGPPPPPDGWRPGGPPPPPDGWRPGGPPPPPDGWGPGGPPPGGWGPSRPPPGGLVPGGPPPSGGWLPSGLPPEGLYGGPDPNYVGNPPIPPMGCGPIPGPPPPQGFAPVPMMPGYGPVGEYGAVANYATIPPPTWPNEARTCFPPNQEVIVNPTPDQPAWIKALISGPEITEKTTEDTSLKKSKQPKDEAKVSTKKAKRQGLLGTRTFDKPPPGRSTGIISFIGPTYGFIEREDLKKFTFSFDAFFGSRKALAPGVRVHFTACKEMSNEIATDVKVAPGGTENVDTEIYEGVVIESYTESQIGVKQKPGYVEVIVGPEKSKLPYEKRDCTVTLLTGDHVLINLLTDIVTQNKRATNIKPKIPATFKHTAEKREMGAILNIKETEGTIVSKDNPNLPFDLTENLDDTEFSPTDAVEFTVLSVKGKKMAIRVRKLKGGSVQFDSGTQGVLEEIKEKEETKKKDEVALAKDKWKPVSLAVPPVMTNVEEDISNEQYEGTVLKAIPRNPLPLAEGQEPEKGRLVMTMAGEPKHLTFEPQDIRTTATMLDGDKINFNISTHRETKKERAINIKISPETFAESTEQRRTGMVVEIEDQSGVIKCQQNPHLFFHMSEVMEFKKVELNEKVEFSVIPHETAEGGSQAIRIKRLTERVFLPVPKLGGMATQKIKKQMTIKLMKDSTTNFDDKGKPEDKEEKLSTESDKLKAVVKTLRSKDTKPSTGRKDGDGSRRRNERSKSRSRSRSRSPVRSPVKDEFGRQRRLQSSSREQDRHSKSRRSRSRERSRRRSRSRSRSRDRMGSKGRSSQRSRRDSSLPPEDPRHSSGVDDELARKKRELEELNDMIARRKAMVTMVPREGIMDMRPMEKTCIDYDHGRIAVPITEFKPVKSILKKRTESVSGPLFPIKNEPPDHDQYHYNPPTLDHIQSFDSSDQSHLLYSQRSSKMSYYDDSSYEQTSTQDHFYQSQSLQEHSALVNPHSVYQSPPSQPNPSNPTPNQLSPQQIPPTQSPPCQSPPSSQTPHSLLSSQSALHPIIPEQSSSVPSSSSKQSSSPPDQMSSPEGKHNLTTQISRFLNILNKGVDASLFSPVVKEAQNEIAVSADNVQVVPQSHAEVKTGKYDPHRVREADHEKTFSFSRDVLRTHDEHDSGINTDHSQDDLLPHERAIQDGSGFSRILSMAQEKYSPSAYQKATDMDEDEKFLYQGKGSAAYDEHYRSSSGSREKQKPVREGRKLSPARQTREGSTGKSEHFDKIQSLLRTIGLNLDTGEVSKLADRTQERLYGRAEKSSSERGSTEHREREHSSSRREERRRSRTGSADSEHLRSISPTRVPSRTAYSSYEPTSEYTRFLDQAEEEALEKARQMQSLTKTVRNAPEQTMPITPPSNPTLVTSSSAMYPHQQPGYSYAISQYGWPQGASTQYAVPPSSAAPSSSQQAPEVYQQAQYSSYGGHTSSLPSHYYGQPSPGPSPVSPYPIQSLAPTVQSTSLAKPQHVNTLIQVKPLTSTSDNSKQTVVATSVSRCLKVIETVTTEMIQKEASKSAKVVQFNLQSSEAAQLGEKTLSETEDDIEAKQKKRLEQFNQRMMEKSKQQFTQRKNDKLTRHTQARDKHQNNPPGKVISAEPRNIWICGHSLIYWAEMRAKSPEVGMQLGMDPSSVVVWWKGMQGMTWPQLLPQLLQLKIKWPNPDVIIMHLGGNDLGTDSPTDLLASVKKDLTSMRSIFPQCLLVWSDILPRRVWRHSEDSLEVDLVRATVNRRVHSIIAELGGTALTHDNIRCGTDTGLYRPDGVHLSGKGIDTYNLNLQDFLEKWEIEANNATE